MIQVFAHDGEAGFEGAWTTLTSAKSFDNLVLNVPQNATHWVRYSTGATAALIISETLTGGTSHNKCTLVGQWVENGTAGSSDTGILFIQFTNGVKTFVAETLTGALSTGTVAIVNDFIPILSYSPPKAALITVETASIKFSLAGSIATVTAGTSNIHQMDAGQSYVVRGYKNIRKFSAINAVASNGAIMKYTLFY